MFICFICFSAYNSIKDLFLHYRINHGLTNTSNYSCAQPDCLNSYSSKNLLVKYLKKHKNKIINNNQLEHENEIINIDCFELNG